MKLFTKETLTHTSLYQLGVARRDRGRLCQGGRGAGQKEFSFFSVLQQARLPSKEDKSGGQGKAEGWRLASTLKRDTGGLLCPPLSRKAAESAQPGPGHRHYTRRRCTLSNTLIL